MHVHPQRYATGESGRFRWHTRQTPPGFRRFALDVDFAPSTGRAGGVPAVEVGGDEMSDARAVFRRRWLVAIAAAAIGLLAGAMAASAARADNYVSLGDSYVAGPFIPNPVLPLGCLK